MRKKTIIQLLTACGFLLLPLASTTANASGVAEQAKIAINVSGTIYEFYLADSPVITFQDNVLEVKSEKGKAISVDAKEVGAFTFVPSATTGIDPVQLHPSTTFGSKMSGLTPGSRVVVATLDGKVVLSQVADEQGAANVDFASLPSGLLILKTEKGSIKIRH